MAKKLLSLILAFTFITQSAIPAGYAQSLPVSILPVLANLPVLKYLSLNPANPNNYFNFLMDNPSVSPLVKGGIEGGLNLESRKLINYFFLGLTLPLDAFWVNLQPNQEDKLTSSELSKTDLGKVLLEQDLKLKKDMANYLSPKNPIGKEYWEKLYERVEKESESQSVKVSLRAKRSNLNKINIQTNNRVWIVPEKSVVVETEDGALITEAKLKVMLESEYLRAPRVIASPTGAWQSDNGIASALPRNDTDRTAHNGTIAEISESLMKEIILPAITKDVNESSGYAPLRQIYHSLILAQYFKKRRNSPNSMNSYSSYLNSGKTQGLESQAPWSKDAIYQDYLKSYTQGEYKFIDKTIFNLKRMYFSGGIGFSSSSISGKRGSGNDEIMLGMKIASMGKFDGFLKESDLSILPRGALPVVVAGSPVGKNNVGVKVVETEGIILQKNNNEIKPVASQKANIKNNSGKIYFKDIFKSILQGIMFAGMVLFMNDVNADKINMRDIDIYKFKAERGDGDATMELIWLMNSEEQLPSSLKAREALVVLNANKLLEQAFKGDFGYGVEDSLRNLYRIGNPIVVNELKTAGRDKVDTLIKYNSKTKKESREFLDTLSQAGNPNLPKIYEEAKKLNIEYLGRFSVEAQREIIDNRLILKPDRRPLVVAIYPKVDDSSTFYSTKNDIQELMRRGYRVVYYEVSEDWQMLQSIKEATKNQEARVLYFAGHGNPTTLSFGARDPGYSSGEGINLGKTLDLTDVEWLKREGIANTLESNGQIVLAGCNNGEGGKNNKNLANMVRELFPQAQKEGIFSLMESDSIYRLEFDKNNRIRNLVTIFGEYRAEAPKSKQILVADAKSGRSFSLVDNRGEEKSSSSSIEQKRSLGGWKNAIASVALAVMLFFSPGKSGAENLSQPSQSTEQAQITDWQKPSRAFTLKDENMLKGLEKASNDLREELVNASRVNDKDKKEKINNMQKKVTEMVREILSSYAAYEKNEIVKINGALYKVLGHTYVIETVIEDGKTGFNVEYDYFLREGGYEDGRSLKLSDLGKVKVEKVKTNDAGSSPVENNNRQEFIKKDLLLFLQRAGINNVPTAKIDELVRRIEKAQNEAGGVKAPVVDLTGINIPGLTADDGKVLGMIGMGGANGVDLSEENKSASSVVEQKDNFASLLMIVNGSGSAARLNREKADQWIAEAKDNLLVQSVRKKIVENIEHVTFDKFNKELNVVVSRLNEVLSEDDNSYAVLWDYAPHKSRRWVYSLAEQSLLRKPLVATYFSGKSEKTTHILRGIADKGIQRFVIMDDASYSGNGSQIIITIREIKKMYFEWGLADPEFIVVVPFITEQALNALNAISKGNEAVKVFFSKKMNLVSEILSTEENEAFSEYQLNLEKNGKIRTLRVTGDAVDSHVTLTFFDHKLPDSYSFLEYVYPLLEKINYKKPYDNEMSDYYQKEVIDYDLLKGKKERGEEENKSASSSIKESLGRKVNGAREFFVSMGMSIGKSGLVDKNLGVEHLGELHKWHQEIRINGIDMPDEDAFIKKVFLAVSLWRQVDVDGGINYLFGKGIGSEIALQGEVLKREKRRIFPVRSHSDFELYGTKGHLPYSEAFRQVFGSQEIYPFDMTKGLKDLPEQYLLDTAEDVSFGGINVKIPQLELLFLDKFMKSEATPRKEGTDAELLAQAYSLDRNKINKYLQDFVIVPKIRKADEKYARLKEYLSVEKIKGKYVRYKEENSKEGISGEFLDQMSANRLEGEIVAPLNYSGPQNISRRFVNEAKLILKYALEDDKNGIFNIIEDIKRQEIKDIQEELPKKVNDLLDKIENNAQASSPVEEQKDKPVSSSINEENKSASSSVYEKSGNDFKKRLLRVADIPNLFNRGNAKNILAATLHFYLERIPRINPAMPAMSENKIVYYPGAAYDLVGPLAATNASRYIFLDKYKFFDGKPGGIDNLESMRKQLELIGATEIITDATVSDRTVWDFNLSGPDGQIKKRQIIYYINKDARLFIPPEFVEHGYDILYLANSPFSRLGQETGKFLSYLRKEGYAILDNIGAGHSAEEIVTRSKELGFDIILNIKTQANFDGGIIFVQKKSSNGSSESASSPINEKMGEKFKSSDKFVWYHRTPALLNQGTLDINKTSGNGLVSKGFFITTTKEYASGIARFGGSEGSNRIRREKKDGHLYNIIVKDGFNILDLTSPVTKNNLFEELVVALNRKYNNVIDYSKILNDQQIETTEKAYREILNIIRRYIVAPTISKDEMDAWKKKNPGQISVFNPLFTKAKQIVIDALLELNIGAIGYIDDENEPTIILFNPKEQIVKMEEVSIAGSSPVSRGGIDLNNIEIILKDEKFVSNLNPADYKILLAAKALREGSGPLSLLRIHEAMGLLKSDIVKSIRNRGLLIQLLTQLQSRKSLDSQGMQFLHFIQNKKSTIGPVKPLLASP